MTDSEKQNIIDAVLSALSTNSRTIEQLMSTPTLSSSDFFEISGGRKVGLDVLAKHITSGIESLIQGNTDSIDKLKPFVAAASLIARGHIKAQGIPELNEALDSEDWNGPDKSGIYTYGAAEHAAAGLMLMINKDVVDHGQQIVIGRLRASEDGKALALPLDNAAAPALSWRNHNKGATNSWRPWRSFGLADVLEAIDKLDGDIGKLDDKLTLLRGEVERRDSYELAGVLTSEDLAGLTVSATSGPASGTPGCGVWLHPSGFLLLRRAPSTGMGDEQSVTWHRWWEDAADWGHVLDGTGGSLVMADRAMYRCRDGHLYLFDYNGNAVRAGRYALEDDLEDGLESVRDSVRTADERLNGVRRRLGGTALRMQGLVERVCPGIIPLGAMPGLAYRATQMPHTLIKLAPCVVGEPRRFDLSGMYFFDDTNKRTPLSDFVGRYGLFPIDNSGHGLSEFDYSLDGEILTVTCTRGNGNGKYAIPAIIIGDMPRFNEHITSRICGDGGKEFFLTDVKDVEVKVAAPVKEDLEVVDNEIRMKRNYSLYAGLEVERWKIRRRRNVPKNIGWGWQKYKKIPKNGRGVFTSLNSRTAFVRVRYRRGRSRSDWTYLYLHRNENKGIGMCYARYGLK